MILVQEHGSRLEGNTDIINCIEQHQLLDRIFQYAMRYDSMILGYRECPNRSNHVLERTAARYVHI